MKIKRLNSNGMTLTEVIAGFAIIAIVSLIMASGFLAASAYIQRANQIKNASSAAYSKLEAGLSYDASVAATLQFGSYGTIYGNIESYSASNDSCSVTYSEFNPG